MGTRAGRNDSSPIGRAVRLGASMFGSAFVTAGLFLALPMINQIAEGEPDLLIQDMDQVQLPPPDPIEEPEDEPEEEEPEPEDEPPELEEPMEQLDLAQLELALSMSDGMAGQGIGGMDFGLRDLTAAAAEGIDELISAGDLDGGRPQPISENPPRLSARERKATPGNVVVLYKVDTSGRVSDVVVKQSTSEILSRVAIRTVKKWRYKPGTKDGRPVGYRVKRRMPFSEQ